MREIWMTNSFFTNKQLTVKMLLRAQRARKCILNVIPHYLF